MSSGKITNKDASLFTYATLLACGRYVRSVNQEIQAWSVYEFHCCELSPTVYGYSQGCMVVGKLKRSVFFCSPRLHGQLPLLPDCGSDV